MLAKNHDLQAFYQSKAPKSMAPKWYRIAIDGKSIEFLQQLAFYFR
jgi:hypothetical protein